MRRSKTLRCFNIFCVSARRVKGLPTLDVAEFGVDGKLLEQKGIAFPEPVYSAAAHVNREFATTKFRYSYQSLVSPASVFEYDVKTAESVLLKQQEVPGGFDRERYASERVWVTAEDGVRGAGFAGLPPRLLPQGWL